MRQNGFKITTSEDLYNFESSKITILPNPNRKLSAREFENLKSYVINGGSILILLSANGEKGSGSNINFFLEEFGISVNSDTVIRPSFVKVCLLNFTETKSLFRDNKCSSFDYFISYLIVPNEIT